MRNKNNGFNLNGVMMHELTRVKELNASSRKKTESYFFNLSLITEK